MGEDATGSVTEAIAPSSRALGRNDWSSARNGRCRTSHCCRFRAGSSARAILEKLGVRCLVTRRLASVTTQVVKAGPPDDGSFARTDTFRSVPDGPPYDRRDRARGLIQERSKNSQARLREWVLQ